jgi:hypothetical protein
VTVRVCRHALLRVGNGTEDVHPEYGADCIRIPAAMCCEDHTVKALLDQVYGHVSQLSTAEERAEYFTSRVVLAPKNEDVHVINKMMHERVQGADEYLSAYTSTTKNRMVIPLTFPSGVSQLSQRLWDITASTALAARMSCCPFKEPVLRSSQ